MPTKIFVIFLINHTTKKTLMSESIHPPPLAQTPPSCEIMMCGVCFLDSFFIAWTHICLMYGDIKGRLHLEHKHTHTHTCTHMHKNNWSNNVNIMSCHRRNRDHNCSSTSFYHYFTTFWYVKPASFIASFNEIKKLLLWYFFSQKKSHLEQFI